MLTCLTCGASFPDIGQIVAHLSVVHLVAPSEAIRRAREIADAAPTQPIPPAPRWTSAIRPPAPKEATQMANETYTCHKCGTKGHNARSPGCPQKGQPATPKKACTYCKHTDHVYADCPLALVRRKGKKRQPVTRQSPKAAPSVKGFTGALTAIRAERDELNAAIAALERLEARGR